MEKTKTYCLAIDLKNDPVLIAEYEAYHKKENIWPEIINGIKACGILKMNIYRIDERLVMIIETTTDFDLEEGFKRMSELPRQQDWADLMAGYQVKLLSASPIEHWALMTHIFDING